MKDALDVVGVWPDVREHLNSALEEAQGTHTEEDILRGVLSGSLQLWVGSKSAGVTEIVIYPRFRAVRVFLAGGDMEELRYMETVIIREAKKAGLARIEIGGRRGFLRALPGYEELCTTIVKTL